MRRLSLVPGPPEAKTAPWDSSQHPRGAGGKFAKKNEPTQRGDQGKNVKALQEALNKLGAKPPLAVDGVFGPKTEAALKEFQGQWNLDLSGLVDKNTSETLSLAVGIAGSEKKPKSSGSRSSGGSASKKKKGGASTSGSSRRRGAGSSAKRPAAKPRASAKPTRRITSTKKPVSGAKPSPAKKKPTAKAPTASQKWVAAQRAKALKQGFADSTVSKVEKGDEVIYYATVSGVTAQVRGTVGDVQEDRIWFNAGSGYVTVNGSGGKYKVGGWVSFPPGGKIMRKPTAAQRRLQLSVA